MEEEKYRLKNHRKGKKSQPPATPAPPNHDNHGAAQCPDLDLPLVYTHVLQPGNHSTSVWSTNMKTVTFTLPLGHLLFYGGSQTRGSAGIRDRALHQGCLRASEAGIGEQTEEARFSRRQLRTARRGLSFHNRS